MSSLRRGWERVVFGFALFGCLTAGLWTWRQREKVSLIRVQSVASPQSGPGYEPRRFEEPDLQPMAWPKPRAQPSGGDWIYEVFTPPVIYHDVRTSAFAVTRPVQITDDRGGGFGFELVEVKREPYRLQLAGYFGGPGNYLAAFVSHELPETLLGRTGKRFEPLGLTLRSFEVRMVEVAHHDSRPVHEVAAQAVVFDEKAGAEVLLDSRVRKFTDTPLAVLRAPAATGPSRILREGEDITDGSTAYRVESIQLDPPEVVLTRLAAGSTPPEIRVLRPAGKEREVAARSPRLQSFPASPRSGLAANDP